MFTLMKILHLFGLMLGAGGGLGSMMVAVQARRLEGPPPPAFAAMRGGFAQAGLIGIVLLWATGLWLWLVELGGVNPGWLYMLKLVAAAAILAIAVAARLAMARATPGRPPPAFIQRLGPLSGVLAYVAVALAVIVFG